MCLNWAVHSSFLPLPQGTVGFEQHIDKCLELSAYLYEKIQNRAGFEMVFNGEVGSSEYCYRLMHEDVVRRLLFGPREHSSLYLLFRIDGGILLP